MKYAILVVLGYSLMVCGNLKAAEAVKRVAIEVLEPERRSGLIEKYPVSVGLVFPEDELGALPCGQVVDDRGEAVRFEAEATGWWDEQHTKIKWLLLHFPASSDRQYTFEIGSASEVLKGQPLARRQGDAVAIDTGPLHVIISDGNSNLFSEVKLNGKLMLQSLEAPHTLVADFEKKNVAGKLESWKVELEESTPMRAMVKAGGIYRFPDGKPMARVDVRYQFYKGESFVRVYHTLTWMVVDLAVGIRDLNLQLKPAFADSGRVRVGLSPENAEAFEGKWAKSTLLSAIQDQGDHFSIQFDGVKAAEGAKVGGWIDLASDGGQSISVNLRHAWQRYPAAMALKDGQFKLSFWSESSEPLSFTKQAIMGDRIFFHPTWVNYEFSREKKHFVDNYENNKGYRYSAEGAAFSHELLIGFHDGTADTRSAEELSNVTNAPLVLRQDPVVAMRVPFMGFDIMPSRPDKYPDIERAVDQIGTMAMARWLSENNYGLLRFGMVRWSQHGQASYYRWMDNTQYDQQLIPWLLFMRGGDRRWFEEGEITSRFAMDMSTNHYNTRELDKELWTPQNQGICPPGYMADAGGALPLPRLGFNMADFKTMKIHFLAYHYHLTGNPRAKDVLDEVIAGCKEFTKKYLDAEGEIVGGREVYNSNTLWANIYEETHDPEIKVIAEKFRKATVDREYKPEVNEFDGPDVYLYNGLVFQDRTFNDPHAHEIMLKHLSYRMLCFTEMGGIAGTSSLHHTIACPWAFEQTKDDRYAQLAWDVARGMAEFVPDTRFDGESPPIYPAPYWGNELMRSHLMPILTGASLGDRLGMKLDAPRSLRDLFVYLVPGEGKATAEAFVRPRKDGSLKLRLLGRTEVPAGKLPLSVKITDQDGKEIKSLTIQPNEAPALAAFMADVEMPSAYQNQTYRVQFENPDSAISVAVLCDAKVVYHLSPDVEHGHEPLCGGMESTPVTMVTQASDDTVAFRVRVIPYTIRDAKTGELILRPATFDAAEVQRQVGKGRMLLISAHGCRHGSEWRTEGMVPYFANSLDGWFNPEETP